MIFRMLPLAPTTAKNICRRKIMNKKFPIKTIKCRNGDKESVPKKSNVKPINP